MSEWFPKDFRIADAFHKYKRKFFYGSQNNRAPTMDPPPKSMFASFVSTKGLSNKAGENNCFLNSAVQVLWHLDAFRKNFHRLSHHVCVANSCVFCALKVIFTQFQFSEEKVLPPDALRKALAVAFENQQRFQLGLMDDAAECFENILTRIHFHISGNTDDNCVLEHCIPHQKFAMMVIEQVVCDCGETSEPLPFVELVHYVTAHTVMSFSQKPRSSESFGDMLRLAHSDGNLRNECPGKCGRQASVKRTLTNFPDIVSIGLVWDSDEQTAEQVKCCVEALRTNLHLKDLFDSLVDVDRAQESEHRLVGIVCYYGKHYSAFFLHSKSNNWMSCDDATVTDVGPNWNDVVEKCYKGRYQPLLLLYQNPRAELISTKSAPKKTTMLTRYMPPNKNNCDDHENQNGSEDDDDHTAKAAGPSKGSHRNGNSSNNCNSGLSQNGLRAREGPVLKPSAPPAAPSVPEPRPTETGRPAQRPSEQGRPLPALSSSKPELSTSRRATHGYDAKGGCYMTPLQEIPLSTSHISQLHSPSSYYHTGAGVVTPNTALQHHMAWHNVQSRVNNLPYQQSTVPAFTPIHAPTYSNNYPGPSGYTGMQNGGSLARAALPRGPVSQEPPLTRTSSAYAQQFQPSISHSHGLKLTSFVTSDANSYPAQIPCFHSNESFTDGDRARSAKTLHVDTLHKAPSEVNLMEWSIIGDPLLSTPDANLPTLASGRNDSDSESSLYDDLLDLGSPNMNDQTSSHVMSGHVTIPAAPVNGVPLVTRNTSLTDSYYFVPDADHFKNLDLECISDDFKDLVTDADQLMEQSVEKEKSGDIHGALICCNHAINVYATSRKESKNPKPSEVNMELEIKVQNAKKRSTFLLQQIVFDQQKLKGDAKNRLGSKGGKAGLTTNSHGTNELWLTKAEETDDLILWNETSNSTTLQALQSRLPTLYNQNPSPHRWYWDSTIGGTKIPP